MHRQDMANVVDNFVMCISEFLNDVKSFTDLLVLLQTCENKIIQYDEIKISSRGFHQGINNYKKSRGKKH